MMHIFNEMCGDNGLVDIGIKIREDREARSRSISQKHVNRLRNSLSSFDNDSYPSLENYNSVKKTVIIVSIIVSITLDFP